MNIPDSLLKDAKRKALEEGRTVTDLVVEGPTVRIRKQAPEKPLPVSTAAGGPLPGVDWTEIDPAQAEGERCR